MNNEIDLQKNKVIFIDLIKITYDTLDGVPQYMSEDNLSFNVRSVLDNLNTYIAFMDKKNIINREEFNELVFDFKEKLNTFGGLLCTNKQYFKKCFEVIILANSFYYNLVNEKKINALELINLLPNYTDEYTNTDKINAFSDIVDKINNPIMQEKNF